MVVWTVDINKGTVANDSALPGLGNIVTVAPLPSIVSPFDVIRFSHCFPVKVGKHKH
jgi:hypothetical protein